MLFRAKLNDEGQTVVNGVVICKKALADGRNRFELVRRTDEIKFLLGLMVDAEMKIDRECLSDELLFLFELRDEMVFRTKKGESPEYVAKSDDEFGFRHACSLLLALNEEYAGKKKK